MEDTRLRTEMLIGKDAIERLSGCRIAVFGVGGVGGYAVEALARTGVGTLDIVDADDVAPSNLNRQIIATLETVGRTKVDVFAERIRSIDPAIKVNRHRLFYLPQDPPMLDFSAYDYVIDAVDTVKAKIDIIARCVGSGVPVISAMGCGNRLDPSKLSVMDLAKTSMDPLAKVMRRELKKLGIAHVKTVCSSEEPIKPVAQDEPAETMKRSTPGSAMFVPAAAGLLIASEVVRDLIKTNG